MRSTLASHLLHPSRLICRALRRALFYTAPASPPIVCGSRSRQRDVAQPPIDICMIDRFNCKVDQMIARESAIAQVLPDAAFVVAQSRLRTSSIRLGEARVRHCAQVQPLMLMLSSFIDHLDAYGPTAQPHGPGVANAETIYISNRQNLIALTSAEVPAVECSSKRVVVLVRYVVRGTLSSRAREHEEWLFVGRWRWISLDVGEGFRQRGDRPMDLHGKQAHFTSKSDFRAIERFAGIGSITPCRHRNMSRTRVWRPITCI